jgi:proliferating cell nuclear antigen
MASLFKLIRTASSHDTVVFFIRNDNINSELGITIINSEKNSKTTFHLKLLDVDAESINIPSVEFQSIMTLPSAYLQRICRDMLNISDHLTLSCSNGVLSLSCDGDFARQETIIGESDDCLAVSLKNENVITSRFSLKYLSLFCRASSLCNVITLYMREEYPLILRYNVASLGELSFALAPKIDD